MFRYFLPILLTVAGFAQTADPSYASLEKAYDSLRSKNYDSAIASFQLAIAAHPERASIHKDLAYTLLKIGEVETARDAFGEAMRLDPHDYHVALEYAFLCNETKQQSTARRIFDRIRKTGDPETQRTAEQAFQNIDRPLAESIDRWLKAVALTPDNFSVHEELAGFAEQRDQPALAAEHYEKAWHLRPDRRSLLLGMGRAWKSLGKSEEAYIVLLAASRGAEARVAEAARELMPARYPFVYEFQKALVVDPKNVDLRRELAYLHMQMNQSAEAESEFQTIVELAPDDLLSVAQLGFLKLSRKDTAAAMPLLDKVLKGNDEELADRVRSALKIPQTLHRRAETPRSQVTIEAKVLAERSLQAGYLKDAVKYLKIAHESDPVDFDVMLKLGRTYNNLKQDDEAVRWFGLARNSPEPAVAAEATQAYRNLNAGHELFRTTAWALPFYSSRWKDVFAYGQVKTELRLGNLPIHPYLSLRFVGDTRGSTSLAGDVQPQYLSESSFIAGVGVATKSWHGAMGWFEAGEAMKYLGQRTDVGFMIPDFRGGVSFSRGFGHMLGGESRGWFAENNDDAVFISRFHNDLLLYSQNKTGYTLGGIQLLMNWNVTTDVQHQYWANAVEFGPGVRFRIQTLPKSLQFSINAVRGVYLVNEGNPRKPNYYDLRVGVWYAFSR